MEYAIRFDPADGIFTVTHSGDFDFEDFIRATKDLLSHPQWRPGRPLLLDYRSVNLLQVPTDLVHQGVGILQMNDSFFGNSILAVIVKDRGNFGIGRMIQIIAEGKVSASLELFTDIEAGYQWLKSIKPSP